MEDNPKKNYPFPNQFFYSADQKRKHQLVIEKFRNKRQFSEFTLFTAVLRLMQKNRHHAQMGSIDFVFQPAM